ncbi:hypothetical protein L3V83_09420 [Thiotrichales bacterium 19X7-9]|nr:hypothetical protein [Thiotrichales bacterium 19X7-9]
MSFTALMFLSPILLFISINNGYADAIYKLEIKNETFDKLNFVEERKGSECFYPIDNKYKSLSIQPRSSKIITLKDNNTFLNSCFGARKFIELTFGIQSKGGYKDENKIVVQVLHELGSFIWTTKITPDYWSNHNLKMTAATCNGVDCFQKFHDANGDMSLTVTIKADHKVNGGALFKSIGLGKVIVTSDLGKTVNLENGIDFSKKYRIHFSKINKTCVLNKGFVTCPSEVGYKNINDTLVFVCQKIQGNSSICPWLLSKKSKSLASNLNIYQ